MKKRLKHHSRLAFIERYCHLHEAYVLKCWFYKSLLVSQLFIDSFFSDPIEQRLLISMLDTSFTIQPSSFYSWHQMSLSSSVMKTLILLSQMERIQLAFSAFRFDQAYLEMCMEFCGALKRSKSLKVIDLRIRSWESHRKLTNQVFADLLPNKIDNLKGCIDYMFVFKRHNIQCLTVWDDMIRKQDYNIIEKTHLFRLKAKRIQFDSNTTLSLFDIAVIGPLRKNFEIKELAIHFRFIIYCQEYFQSEIDWIQEYGPKIKKAFEFLKVMNPNLILELKADAGHLYKAKDLSGVSNIISSARWSLNYVADQARSIGLQIKYLNLTWEVAVVSTKFFDDYSVKVPRKLYMKMGSNRQLETSYEYKGTRTNIALKCYRNREYRTKDRLFENRIQY